MAEIPMVKLSVLKGVIPMAQAAAADTAQVGANKQLIVHNGDAGAHTVTIAVPGNDFTGAATNNMVASIAAGEYAAIPLLDVYADPASNNQAVITYDATPATLKRAVVAY